MNIIEQIRGKTDEELTKFISENPHLRTKKALKQMNAERKNINKQYHKEIKVLEQRKNAALADIESLRFPEDAPIKIKMDWLKQNHFDIFQDVFGKQYDDVGMYEDYRENLFMAGIMFVAEKVTLSTDSLKGLTRVKLWKSYGYPNFFVSSQIAEAIENTDLSEEQSVNPTMISLPYEAFAIVFPKGKTPFWLIHVERDEEGLHLYGRFRDKDAEDAKAFVSSDEFKIKDVEYPHNLVADWLFKILYVMHSKPEIIQTGKRLGVQKKTNTVWYEPVIIGAKYQYKSFRKDDAASSISRRTHWRRGHFRNQKFGIRQSPETKVIWIEPMLINAAL